MTLANSTEASQEHAGTKNELPLILPNFKLKQLPGYYIGYCISSCLAWGKAFFLLVTAVTFKNLYQIKWKCVVYLFEIGQ